MSWLGDLLRRARIRGLAEGKVQTVRTEATEHDAKDSVERWQDYGFAAHPVDGHGLVINWGGHTVVLRMDRLSERPQLDAYEVAVWHREGHMVKLKAGRLVHVTCADYLVEASNSYTVTSPTYTVNASSGAAFNTPLVDLSDDLHVAGMATSDVDFVSAGVSGNGHVHGGVKQGTDQSAGPT